MLSTSVDSFEPSLLLVGKMEACVVLCTQANGTSGVFTGTVTFPHTFHPVWVFLKVDWVFNCVICEAFDGVVQITGGERAKQKEFFEDQKWLFILLSDPICCHGNRLLLTCVMGWFASISSKRSFDWGRFLQQQLTSRLSVELGGGGGAGAKRGVPHCGGLKLHFQFKPLS